MMVAFRKRSLQASSHTFSTPHHARNAAILSSMHHTPPPTHHPIPHPLHQIKLRRKRSSVTTHGATCLTRCCSVAAYMPAPLGLVAAAGAGGGLGGLGLNLLRELLTAPGLEPSAFSCPAAELALDAVPESFAIHPPSLLLGLLLELCIGPVLDLLFLIRHSWGRFARNQVRVVTRNTPLYRLLASALLYWRILCGTSERRSEPSPPVCKLWKLASLCWRALSL